MKLLDSDRAFLQKRTRFVRSWRYVGPALTCIIAVIGGWLFFQYPLLANPAHVVAELQNGGIEQKTTELMAALLPIAVCLLIFLCLVGVLFSFASFSNERKYLEIIARADAKPGQTPNHSLQARRP